MTFLGLGSAPLSVVAVAALAVVLFLYTVRWRVPQYVVSTTALWLKSAVRKMGSQRLGVLERPLSLLLQLFIALCLLGAIGEPRLSCQSAPRASTLFVLDRSASMGTIERVESRLQIARRRLSTRLGNATDVDAAGLVLAGGEPVYAVPLGLDPAVVRAAAMAAPLSAGAGHLDRAVALACRELSGAARASIVIFSDGTEESSGCDGVTIERVDVGTARSNVGITAFGTALTANQSQRAEALVEVLNAAKVAVQLELRLSIDGRLIGAATLDLAAGQRLQRSFKDLPLSAPGRLLARLTKIRFADGSEDALHEDDEAYSVFPRGAVVRVGLVGDDPALTLALKANPRYAVTSERDPRKNDVTVIVGEVPGPLGPGAYLLVNPSGPNAPAAVRGRLRGPAVTSWQAAHPILRRVVLSDLAISAANQVDPPSASTVLVSSAGAPLLYTTTGGGRRTAAFTFDLGDSNLPLRVGFPVLIYNTIEWLLDREDTHLADGEIATREPVDVTSPDGRISRLDPIDGLVHVPTAQAGFYTVTTPAGQALTTLSISVADPGESAVTPRDASAATVPSSGRLRDHALGPWLLVAALLLSLLEWFTYQRRITT